MSVEKVHLDVRYNPDIIRGLIDDLTTQVDVKCALVKKDVDFMSTLIKQSFHLELIKLPKNVKQMSLKQFKKKFGNIEGDEPKDAEALRGAQSMTYLQRLSLGYPNDL